MFMIFVEEFVGSCYAITLTGTRNLWNRSPHIWSWEYEGNVSNVQRWICINIYDHIPDEMFLQLVVVLTKI